MAGVSLSRWTMYYITAALAALLLAERLMAVRYGYSSTPVESPQTLVVVHIVAIGCLCVAWSRRCVGRDPRSFGRIGAARRGHRLPRRVRLAVGARTGEDDGLCRMILQHADREVSLIVGRDGAVISQELTMNVAKRRWRRPDSG